MWINILYACLSMLILSFALGLILTVGNHYFAVKDDDRVEKLTKKLPGYDCAACGYVSCKALAEAMVEGKETSKDACKVISKKDKEILIEFSASVENNNKEPIILK